MDPAGNATAIWLEHGSGNYSLYSSTKALGAEWEEPLVVSSSTTEYNDHRVAVDSTGKVTVVWTWLVDYDSRSISVVYASTKPFGGIWDNTPIRVSEVADPPEHTMNNSFTPQIVVDQDDNTTVIWSHHIDESDFHAAFIQTATRPSSGPNDGVWLEPVNVSPHAAGGMADIAPQLGVDSTNKLTAVWFCGFLEDPVTGIIQVNEAPMTTGGAFLVVFFYRLNSFRCTRSWGIWRSPDRC